MLDAIIQHIKQVENPTDLMTNHSAPDSASMASSTDSLIGPPLLHHNSSFESETLDESSISDDNSTDHSISTDGSDYLGPPPPGSLMDLWDKPILANTFHDLTDLFKDGIVTVDTANTEDTTSEDDSSIISTASMDFLSNKAPVLHHVSATTQVAGLADTGELVDTGGNFCMCNDSLSMYNLSLLSALTWQLCRKRQLPCVPIGVIFRFKCWMDWYITHQCTTTLRHQIAFYPHKQYVSTAMDT